LGGGGDVTAGTSGGDVLGDDDVGVCDDDESSMNGIATRSMVVRAAIL
jgi:hypothetical protein